MNFDNDNEKKFYSLLKDIEKKYPEVFKGSSIELSFNPIPQQDGRIAFSFMDWVPQQVRLDILHARRISFDE